MIVMRRGDGEPVRADLVRDVAVGRDPVGAGDHRIDLAGPHERRGCSVHDHGERDAQRLELPRGQPLALQQRPRLVDPDVLDEPRLPGCAHRAERRPVATGRERAGVAVREEARAGRHERGGVRAHPPAARDLFLVERARPLGRGIVAQLVERPAEVDRRRAGGRRAPRTRRPDPLRAAPPSASPYAAATPIAGAPRTASVRIASATSAADAHRSSTSSSGRRRWSSTTTASSSRRTIRSGGQTPRV